MKASLCLSVALLLVACAPDAQVEEDDESCVLSHEYVHYVQDRLLVPTTVAQAAEFAVDVDQDAQGLRSRASVDAARAEPAHPVQMTGIRQNCRADQFGAAFHHHYRNRRDRDGAAAWCADRAPQCKLFTLINIESFVRGAPTDPWADWNWGG